MIFLIAEAVAISGLAIALFFNMRAVHKTGIAIKQVSAMIADVEAKILALEQKRQPNA